MPRKYGTPKAAKAKADRLFSQLVRSRGRCERCGSTDNLQTAHILSRRFAVTRCDEANAYCMCAKCHMYFTDHPVAFGQFVLERIGDEGYQALVDKARLGVKVDWAAEAVRLKARMEEAA